MIESIALEISAYNHQISNSTKRLFFEYCFVSDFSLLLQEILTTMDKASEPIAAYGQDIYRIKMHVFEKLMSINDLELIQKTNFFLDSLISENKEIPNEETHRAIMEARNRNSDDKEDLYDNVEDLFKALDNE